MRNAYEFDADAVDLPGTEDSLIIEPYRGYAAPQRLHVRGRVLENESVLVKKSNTEIHNLLNSFKRFETDEAPGLQVEVHFKDQTIDLVSNREGYFIADVPLDPPLDNDQEQWSKVNMVLPGIPSTKEDDIKATAGVLLPDPEAEFGIIPDIDDTVLQTHVTSLFRLKMLYVTLL